MYGFRIRLRFVAKSSLGILAGAALFGVAAADDGGANNYEEYARQCRDSGGTPYPYDGNRPLRCEYSSGSSSDSSSDNSGPTWLGQIINNAANADERRQQDRLEAAHAANVLGLQAYNRRDWASALAQFRQAQEQNPDDPVIRQNVVNALSNLQAEQNVQRAEAARVQQNKGAAENMQHSFQSFARTLSAAPATGGLEFTAVTPFSSGSVAPVDAGLVQRRVPPPGANTDPGAQLKGISGNKRTKEGAGVGFDDTGAANGSLMDGANAPVPVATIAADDPPDATAKDPRMIAATQNIAKLQAESGKIAADIERLTKARNNERNKEKMQAMTIKIKKKTQVKQDKLVQIDGATEKKKKLHLVILTEVENAAAKDNSGKPPEKSNASAGNK